MSDFPILSPQPRLHAFQAHMRSVLSHLALMYVLDLANRLGVDLEGAYVAKMEKNKIRTWTTSS